MTSGGLGGQIGGVKSFGRFRIAAVDAGRIWLDGGTMFGVIPRVEWEQVAPPDAQNRIELALRLLLLSDGGDRHILVDTGIGNKLLPAEAARLCLKEPEGGLGEAVRRAGVAPEAITDVILTHLHFDHAGGATEAGRDAGEQAHPTFPNATYHLQRRALKWAQHAPEKDALFFYCNDYRSLAASGQLHLLDGPVELYEGINLVLSEGHSVAMQLPLVDGGDDGKLLFAGDLVPTRAHITLPWLMAYDLYPLTSLEEKRLFLAQALEEEWAVFFEHDPETAACRVREEGGTVVPGVTVSL